MRTKTVDRRRHIGIGMLCAAILLIGAKLLQDSVAVPGNTKKLTLASTPEVR